MAALGSAYIPSWDEDPIAWSTTYLGGVLLPGISSVGQLECGPRIDKQTRRKKEGQKFKDEGMKPAQFSVNQWMTSAEWSRWCEVLPLIYSVQPKGQREPKQIVHPLPMSMGVDVVYVLNVKLNDVTEDGVFKVQINVEQWFEELVEPNTKTQPKLAAVAENIVPTALVVATAILPPAGALLTSLVYDKPREYVKNSSLRGDSGSGGGSGSGGKR